MQGKKNNSTHWRLIAEIAFAFMVMGMCFHVAAHGKLPIAQSTYLLADAGIQAVAYCQAQSLEADP